MTKEEKIKYLGDIVEDGFIVYYKKGRIRRAKEAAKAAQRAYDLQRDELAFQRAQLEKIEAGAGSAEAEVASRQQRLLALKRTGRASTIHTIEKKPGLADFEAKYRDEHPVGDMSEDEYRKKMQTAYDKIQPFTRLIKGAPALKQARLYA